jgi:hypothetical protein
VRSGVSIGTEKRKRRRDERMKNRSTAAFFPELQIPRS